MSARAEASEEGNPLEEVAITKRGISTVLLLHFTSIRLA